jgi:hypothetical protein
LNNQIDYATADGFTEETMSTQSIQELETRMETTCRKIEDTDIEIGKHEVDSDKTVSLLRLRQAYCDFALDLRLYIACEMKNAIFRKLALLEKEVHEATMERVIAENGLSVVEYGLFNEQLNRCNTAEKRFWSAIHARNAFRTKYRIAIQTVQSDKKYAGVPYLAAETLDS